MKQACNLVMAAAPALVSSMALAQADCPAEPISVTARYQGETRFVVDVSAPGSRGGVDIQWRPGGGVEDGTASFISDVAFLDASGRFVPADYAGYGTWLPAGGEAQAWQGYRYTLSATHEMAQWDIGKEEVAYRFDDGFYFVGGAVLALSSAWSACEFSIGFDMPADWQAVTPWPAGTGGRFAVAGLNDVWRNVFVVGPDLQPQTVRIGELEATLLVETPLADARDELEATLTRALTRFAEIFGGVPMERYLVVAGEDPGNDGGAFAQSFGQRMPAPFREGEAISWARLLVHEALHAWLGITISPDPYAESQWFTEGGADYLTTKTLYRAGLIDEHDVIFITEGQIRRFLLGRVMSGQISLAEAGENKQQNRLLVYGGGALFHLMLDARMRQLHGAGAYEAALRALYQAEDRNYSQARFLAELDAASDGAASEIQAVLNGPFDPFALIDRIEETGLSVTAFGPDEILVRFAAQGCAGAREAACMPDFLRP